MPGYPPPAMTTDHLRAFRFQEAVLARVGVDDPDFGLPFVLEAVYVLPRVDDARAVRGDLRVVDALEVHVVLGREPRRRLRLLRADGRHGHSRRDSERQDQSRHRITPAFALTSTLAVDEIVERS